MTSSLIINADDFGYSGDVNRAIIESFGSRLCSSTTIMANMPDFEEACQLYHENNLSKSTGLHVVLSEGIPLTDKIKYCRRFCDEEGRFRKNGKPRILLETDEKIAVYDEIAAQIEICRKHKVHLTHSDSHQHVHVEWDIGQIVLRIAKEYQIPYLRKSRVYDPESMWIKTCYRWYFNKLLDCRGVAATERFGTISDYLGLMDKKKSHREPASFEIMVHPTYDEKGEIIDAVQNRPLREYIQQIDNYSQAQSYAEVGAV